MSIDAFEEGCTYSGVLLATPNGQEVTTPATVSFHSERLIDIEISDAASVMLLLRSGGDKSPWFGQGQSVPEQCVFQSLSGAMTLTRLRFVRRSQNWNVRTVIFAADEVVLTATKSDMGKPSLFDEFTSRFDGLADWWSASILLVRPHLDDEGRTKRMEITTREDVPTIDWDQGDARMTIELSWRSNTDDHNRSWALSQLTNLNSRFDEPRSADEHLDEHWIVKSLVVLMYGKPLRYREHVIVGKADYFSEGPGRKADESLRHFPSRPFLTSRTVRDMTKPSNELGGLRPAILLLDQVGADGLTKWARMWRNGWSRFTSPVVAVLGRDKPFIEDQILACGIFIDAWGKSQEPADGEAATYSSNGKRSSPTFATFVYRALRATRAEWCQVGLTDAELSISVRDVYTAVKHAEKMQSPVNEMILASEVMLLATRLLVAVEVSLESRFVSDFVGDWSFKSKLEALGKLRESRRGEEH